MDSSVSPKDKIWFLRVCHHISTGLYSFLTEGNLKRYEQTPFIRLSVYPFAMSAHRPNRLSNSDEIQQRSSAQKFVEQVLLP
jgi:hypothetical protein